MAAEFHQNRGHVLRCQCGQVLADAGGPGECDKPNLLLLNQVVGNVCRCAEHQVEYARRQSRIVQRLRYVQRACRRFFGCLENDRAARSNGARDLAAGLAHREVPGRQPEDDADRLVMHDVSDARGAGNDPAVSPGRLAGIPLNEFAAADNFQPGLLEGLAVLGRDRSRDLFLALAHQRGRLHEYVRTLRGGCLSPQLKAFLGGFQRIVEISLARVRQATDLFFGCGVQHGESIGRLSPAAINVQAKLGVRAHYCSGS